tara:strand:- start:217 stop:1221 length:1005 start_codon:yes stop_codon:yes gene_type:complete
MSFSYYEAGSYWRPHEFESARKHFGNPTNNLNESNILFSRNNTESLNMDTLKACIALEQSFLKSHSHDGNSKIIINSSANYGNSNNKDECFSIWEKNNIPHPKTIVVNSYSDLEGRKYPYLLRLNDGVTGEDTFLVENDRDLEIYYPQIKLAFSKKQRINTKIICVNFIDTSTSDGYNLSYRVVASGNSVICGYARISDDWLAITKQFTENKKEAFLRENKKLERIIVKNKELILKAMHLTGHQHVGLDIIPDQNGNIYFLEIQPFYFCGATHRTDPPFWNPYKPKELVNWLIQDRENLEKEIPTYYNMWLNKENHFDACYKSLREYADNVWAK